jgi:hypothetical protein
MDKDNIFAKFGGLKCVIFITTFSYMNALWIQEN